MGTGRAGLVSRLPHSPGTAGLALAGRRLSVSAAVLSPLPLDILSACLSACLGLGGGSRCCWDMSSNILCVVRLPPTTPPTTASAPLPCNLNSHWSLSVVVFLFFSSRGSQRREGKGRAAEEKRIPVAAQVFPTDTQTHLAHLRLHFFLLLPK